MPSHEVRVLGSHIKCCVHSLRGHLCTVSLFSLFPPKPNPKKKFLKSVCQSTTTFTVFVISTHHFYSYSLNIFL